MLAKRDIYTLFFLGFFLCIILSSCSTRKNNFFSRKYHNTTTHYNWYFNAHESFKSGVNKFEEAQEIDFNNILSIFQLPDKTNAQSVFFSMDKAIKKSAKAISKHSMLIKNNEYNNWIDDCYLLIGKAYLYKAEHIKSIEAFRLVERQFEGSSTAYKASIWLAKAYTQNKDFSSAEIIFEGLLIDESFPQNLNQELSLAYADYYIKKGDFSEAIIELKEAISLTKKKQHKVRYLFILAQLYQKLDNYEEATRYFSKVLAKNPKYELAFNAKINLARSFDTSKGDTKKLKEQLNKMLKDKKNREYLDVIYFGLAELSIREAKTSEAIVYYAKSVSASVSNDAQKSLSSLKLGSIFYDQQNYISAQSYYDTAVVFMSKSHEEYQTASSKQRTLNDLILNLKMISNQDSLQMVAALSENELFKLIDRIIDKIKEEERLQIKLELDAKNESAFLNGNTLIERNNRLNQSQKIGGTWYFYNPTTLSFGFSEFGRKWGRRKLEDNWRRSNKSALSEIDLTSDTIPEEDFNPKNRESYLAGLPMTIEELKISNNSIMEAYYNAGIIYKEDLEDTPKSLDMFQELNKRFPLNDNRVRVLYFLYRLNLEQQNIEEANNYQQELLRLFPHSEYAKLIKDPLYQETILASKSTVDIIYEDAYKSYLESNFILSSKICQQALKNHPSNLLTPRFKFLEAMARGHHEDVEIFQSLLEKVIESYPEHEVAGHAQNILDQMWPKIEETSSFEEENQPYMEYVKDIKIPHYFIITFKDYDLDVNYAKITMSNYHSEFYNLKRLNTSSLLLDNETHMLSVRQFKNAKDGMNYYNDFLNSEAAAPFGEDYVCFIISESNFPLFFQNKDIKGYSVKFKEFYLN